MKIIALLLLIMSQSNDRLRAIPRPIKYASALVPVSIAVHDIYQNTQRKNDKYTWKRIAICSLITVCILWKAGDHYKDLSPDEFDSWPPKK